MGTIDYKHIGVLQTNPTANVLAGLLVFARFVLMIAAAILGFAIYNTKDSKTIIILGIAAIISVVGILLAEGIRGFLLKKYYLPGDWYKTLEQSAAEEKHDIAREAAEALLALPDGDLVTTKLKAKAHLYLAFYLPPDKGAGHWGKLIPILSHIIECDPNNQEFLVDRAQAFMTTKKLDEALVDLSRAQQSTPLADLRVYSLQISCLTEMGQLQGAQAACDQLEELKPRFQKSSLVSKAITMHRAQIAELQKPNS